MQMDFLQHSSQFQANRTARTSSVIYSHTLCVYSKCEQTRHLLHPSGSVSHFRNKEEKRTAVTHPIQETAINHRIQFVTRIAVLVWLRFGLEFSIELFTNIQQTRMKSAKLLGLVASRNIFRSRRFTKWIENSYHIYESSPHIPS